MGRHESFVLSCVHGPNRANWKFMLTQSVPLAEFVRFFTHDGAMLHGLLWKPTQQTSTLALYVPGLTGTFASPQEMNGFVAPILAANHAALAINLRIAGPPGLAFSRFEDCIADIGAAVQLGESRGYKRIILVGDSLGGCRCTYYWHQARPEAVSALVLLASIPSPLLEARERWSASEVARFDQHLANARRLIAEGNGQDLIKFAEFQPGRDISLSATTWVNTFGTLSESNASTVKFLPEVNIPILVVHGSRDLIALPCNAEVLLAACTSAPRKELIWADAGHFFTTTEDAGRYGAPIAAWISAVVSQSGTIHRL